MAPEALHDRISNEKTDVVRFYKYSTNQLELHQYGF